MITVFKTCPMCRKSWADLDTFLSDPTLVLNGYQPNFGDETRGHFYFTHNDTLCGSSMLIHVERFLVLYDGPHYSDSRHLTEECPQLCHDPYNLKKCTAECKYSYIREILLIVAERLGESSIALVR